jgi:hypothetical protein
MVSLPSATSLAITSFSSIKKASGAATVTYSFYLGASLGLYLRT